MFDEIFKFIRTELDFEIEFSSNWQWGGYTYLGMYILNYDETLRIYREGQDCPFYSILLRKVKSMFPEGIDFTEERWAAFCAFHETAHLIQLKEGRLDKEKYLQETKEICDSEDYQKVVDEYRAHPVEKEADEYAVKMLKKFVE